MPNRWLRIHSLPESKRYAENDEERQEILRRHRQVILDVIGERCCEFVFSYYGEEERLPADLRAALQSLAPAFLTTLTPEESDCAQSFPLLHASFTFPKPELETVLLAVADDVLETPLIIATDMSSIVAPYDGGADIIARDEPARDGLKARYASWLSKHPLGL